MEKIPEDFPLNLKNLTAEEVFAAFQAFPIFPDYLFSKRTDYFTMNLIDNVLISDSKHNTVKVINSPNFPDAGKGLVSNRKAANTKDTSMPFWGCVYVHNNCDKKMNMEKCFQDRLVKLRVQPFKKIGITLYIVGSLSCTASYANDAEFSGWGKRKRSREVLNNCFLWESDPIDVETVKGFVKWLKSCPIWLMALQRITYEEEMLCKYF